MAKEPKHLSDLFHDTLKDVYFAEKKNIRHPSENGKGGTVARSHESLLRSITTRRKGR